MFLTGFINPPGKNNKGNETKPGAGLSKLKCYNCGKLGHKALHCTAKGTSNNGFPPKAATDKAAAAAGRGCYNCGKLGHKRPTKRP